MYQQNLIYEIKDITTESDVTAEPVTLQEAKDFMRLEGFVDDTESTTEELSDFDFDDALITSMIKGARKKLEKWLGVSLVFHTWKVLMDNYAGDQELPYGPLTDFTSLTDSNGTTYGSSVIVRRGFDFQHLEEPMEGKMVAIYEAGYEECPEEIKLAIMQCVAYWYENRVTGEIPSIAMSTCIGYKRPWTWLA